MAWRRKKEAKALENANVSSGQYPKGRDKEKEKLHLKGRQTQQVFVACGD